MTSEYVALRDAIVTQVAVARERAGHAVNTELVHLYWSIGHTILTEQRRHAWGDDVVGLLAQDLRARDDLGRGFSRRNLFYMRRFAALWPDERIVQTLSAQIGWSHHQVLLDAFSTDRDLYGWYAAKSVEHRWSVRRLRGQIDLKLHLRSGAATANYAATLGETGLYLNAVDAKLRHPDDAESIGLILCTSHNRTVAKFALHRSGVPIAVADWQTHTDVDIADELPSNVAAELPGLPEARDRLTSHVAETAERVEGRLLNSGDAPGT